MPCLPAFICSYALVCGDMEKMTQYRDELWNSSPHGNTYHMDDPIASYTKCIIRPTVIQDCLPGFYKISLVMVILYLPQGMRL